MITNIDHMILLWIENHLRYDFITPFWKLITLFSEHGLFWIVLCILLLIFKKTRKIGIVMALAIIVNALLVNVWIKNMVARVRPYDAFDDIIRLIEIQSDYSFPSGHTSVAFSSVMALQLAVEKKQKKYVIVAWLLAFLIGFSRLYLGVHYPSDVLCGALIGAASAVLANWIVKKWIIKDRTECSL